MGYLSLALSYPLTSDLGVSVMFEMCRQCPRGIVVSCSSCGRSGKEYFVLMPSHRQEAKAGLIWCPQCYEGLTGRRYTSGHLGGSSGGRKGGGPLPLQKPGGGVSSSGSLSGTPCTGTIFESFPTLWEFLTLSAWPDATSRKLGTIIVFVEGDRWKACLKDPNGPRVAFVTGKDIDSLFLAVDAGLDAGDLDWRQDRPQGGPGKKLS